MFLSWCALVELVRARTATDFSEVSSELVYGPESARFGNISLSTQRGGRGQQEAAGFSGCPASTL